jgi:hypothetical protein
VLDFPCPTLPTGEKAPANILSVEGLQDFLLHVANRVLGAPAITGALPAGNPPTNPSIPLHARAFLQTLARRGFEKAEYILGNLHSLIQKPAEVTRSRRAASLFVFPALIFITGLLLALMVSFESIRTERNWSNQFPGTPSFPAAAQLYATYEDSIKNGETAGEDLELTRIFLARHFGFLTNNPAFWTEVSLGYPFTQEQRQLVREAVSTPLPEPEKVQEAERVITRRLEAARLGQRFSNIWIVLGWCGMCAFLLSMVDLCGSILARHVPVLGLFSIAVTDESGQPAARPRLLVRWMLAWLPGIVVAVFGLGAVLVALATYGGFADSAQVSAPVASFLRNSATAVSVSAAIVWLLGILYAVIHPQRSLPDRLMGTWLVMK